MCYAATVSHCSETGLMPLILRQFVILVLAALALWAIADMLLLDRRETGPVPGSTPSAPVSQLEPIVPPRLEAQREFVADISVHSRAELEALFGRVEELLERPLSSGEEPLVSLVLHGPEVEFFALKNYSRYREVVDRAAKLAALGAVDISICQAQMKRLGIAADEVPAFLRQVPYGPDEVQRLLEQGYVYM